MILHAQAVFQTCTKWRLEVKHFNKLKFEIRYSNYVKFFQSRICGSWYFQKELFVLNICVEIHLDLMGLRDTIKQSNIAFQQDHVKFIYIWWVLKIPLDKKMLHPNRIAQNPFWLIRWVLKTPLNNEMSHPSRITQYLSQFNGS